MKRGNPTFGPLRLPVMESKKFWYAWLASAIAWISGPEATSASHGLWWVLANVMIAACRLASNARLVRGVPSGLDLAGSSTRCKPVSKAIRRSARVSL